MQQAESSSIIRRETFCVGGLSLLPDSLMCPVISFFFFFFSIFFSLFFLHRSFLKSVQTRG